MDISSTRHIHIALVCVQCAPITCAMLDVMMIVLDRVYGTHEFEMEPQFLRNPNNN